MASLEAIAVALATTIENYTEDELYVYAYPAEAGHLPAVVIGETGGDYGEDLAYGWIEWQFEIDVLLSRVELSESIPALRRIISGSGPNSIPRILLEHADLGLTDGTSVTVTDVRGGIRMPNWNTTAMVGATISVTALTDGRV